MSIETRVVTFSRSFRTLRKTTRRISKTIKDLKALRVLRSLPCYRHSGPTDLRDVFSGEQTMARDRPSPYARGRRFFTVARGPVPREHWIARTMARDRPSPYGEGQAFFSPQHRPKPYDTGQENKK